MVYWSDVLRYEFLNNTVQEYFLALLVLVFGVGILKLFKCVVINRLETWAKRTKTDVDDLIVNVVERLGSPFYWIVSLCFAVQFINIPLLNKIVYYAALIIIPFYIVLCIQEIITYGTKKIVSKQKKDDNSIVELLGKIIKWALWLIAILLILDNLGYNISALLAGLGVGGIAIAFALQNVLTDVFASFSIYLDKPFQKGDFIVTGQDSGTVERIGIKSTRIRTLQGQELVISNKELTESRVHNYKKMEQRRIVFQFGVTYETPNTKLEKIPKIIKDIFGKIKLAKLDRIHFFQFADSSLNFEVVYFLDSSDYTKYMDIQQKINLAIKKEFEKEKIEMAYPTRTVYMRK
ncbi:mechanosensitive ion channel protein MscS [Candidatus Woesearchaeota archaeon CG10_big_fil_rev_8_21_14_0_10_37_12]|nr:MAG: mechanosensitive ion channel protein MscS [Candidatus Woesearchaeota archaeon CG10_big_fil_rev_8_21_14_0_10_37_12]